MCQHLFRPILALCLITATYNASASEKSISPSPRMLPGIFFPGPHAPNALTQHSLVANTQTADSLKNPADADTYFKLTLTVGDKIGNIFSRAISYRGDGFKEVVFRVSGTCVYTVLENDADKPLFNCNYRYDGHDEGNSKVRITNKGGTNTNDKGESSEYRDASGILYNELIWGAPPAALTPGVTWNATLTQPWEMGGPGIQKVTVLATDPANRSITLQREGSSTGYFENDYKQINVIKDGKTILMDVTPGPAHWLGYTIIQNGMVVSDELLVTRPVTLTAGDLKLTAGQREYMLLNQMPVTK
jgi:hypothetical protein